MPGGRPPPRVCVLSIAAARRSAPLVWLIKMSTSGAGSSASVSAGQHFGCPLWRRLPDRVAPGPPRPISADRHGAGRRPAVCRTFARRRRPPTRPSDDRGGLPHAASLAFSSSGELRQRFGQRRDAPQAGQANRPRSCRVVGGRRGRSGRISLSSEVRSPAGLTFRVVAASARASSAAERDASFHIRLVAGHGPAERPDRRRSPRLPITAMIAPARSAGTRPDWNIATSEPAGLAASTSGGKHRHRTGQGDRQAAEIGASANRREAGGDRGAVRDDVGAIEPATWACFPPVRRASSSSRRA